MALSVVDAHVRERLIWLRQQQEDMTILLSQVSTACLHCEKTLQQVGDTMDEARSVGLTHIRCSDRPDARCFFPAGRLQSRAGKAGDQLFAGDASEAAASVHRAGRPHSAGRRHPRHLHEGTCHPLGCSWRSVLISSGLIRMCHCFRTTGSTLVQRWRSVW